MQLNYTTHFGHLKQKNWRFKIGNFTNKLVTGMDGMPKTKIIISYNFNYHTTSIIIIFLKNYFHSLFLQHYNLIFYFKMFYIIVEHFSYPVSKTLHAVLFEKCVDDPAVDNVQNM